MKGSACGHRERRQNESGPWLLDVGFGPLFNLLALHLIRRAGGTAGRRTAGRGSRREKADERETSKAADLRYAGNKERRFALAYLRSTGGHSPPLSAGQSTRRYRGSTSRSSPTASAAGRRSAMDGRRSVPWRMRPVASDLGVSDTYALAGARRTTLKPRRSRCPLASGQCSRSYWAWCR